MIISHPFRYATKGPFIPPAVIRLAPLSRSHLMRGKVEIGEKDEGLLSPHLSKPGSRGGGEGFSRSHRVTFSLLYPFVSQLMRRGGVN